MDNHIRVRILASGQVLDMVPAAAMAKLNAGIAVLVVEEEERQIFGGLRAAVNVAAKFIGAR